MKSKVTKGLSPETASICDAHQRVQSSFSLVRFRSPIAVIAAAVALAACGGGGGSDNNNDRFAGADRDCVNAFTMDASNQLPDETINIICGGEDLSGQSPTDADNDTPGTNPGSVDQTSGGSITPSTVPALNVAPADVAGGQFYQFGDNSAILTGPVFGAGTQTNDSLVKPLAFNIQNSANGLQMIELRAVNTGSNNAMISVVQNTSSTMQCFVKLEGIEEYASSGTPLPDANFFNTIFADGVVGSRPTGSIETDTCVESGDLVYMAGQRVFDFNSIAEVRADDLTGSDGYAPIGVSVTPISYTIGTRGVDITIVNNHSSSVSVSSLKAIILDQNGHAFGYDLALVSESLEAGQEIVVEGLFPEFAGQASTVRAIVNFDIRG